MYSIEWSRILFRTPPGRKKSYVAVAERAHEEGSLRRGWLSVPKVGGTVWALGFTSLLTDISSEMISSVLPMYLVLHLGMSPMVFGLVDSLYQGAAAIFRIAAGVLADRQCRYKKVAVVGYGLSAVCRLLLLLAGNVWTAVVAVIAIDRFGKGIRTAPRDALIAMSSESSELSTAFSVHRSLDAIGAMLGPIVAFTFLALLPEKYDVVFVSSFAFAFLGLAVLFLFVSAGGAENSKRRVTPDSLRGALCLFHEKRFRRQIGSAFILGFATISDSFIFLIFQGKSGIPTFAFPLFYTATSLSTALFAVPLGVFADRFGRIRILIFGYAVLSIVYVLTLLSTAHRILPVLLAILLFGIYYAATDGVLTSMTASILSKKRMGSGLALLATATNLARLGGSLIYGYLWSHNGSSFATKSFLVALVLSAAMAAWLLGSLRDEGEQHRPL